GVGNVQRARIVVGGAGRAAVRVADVAQPFVALLVALPGPHAALPAAAPLELPPRLPAGIARAGPLAGRPGGALIIALVVRIRAGRRVVRIDGGQFGELIVVRVGEPIVGSRATEPL